MIEKYKHCAITNNDKTIYKLNTISGAFWSESVPRLDFYVTGGKLGSRNFKTIDNAKNAIDFDYKFNSKVGG